MKRFQLFIPFFAFLLILNFSSYAQCICEKTNQDKTLNEVYLADMNGNKLPASYECSEGQTSQVAIYAVFNGNADRYSLFIHYDLYLDDVNSETISKCMWKNQVVPTGTPQPIDTISWTCGAEVKLVNFFMSWQANAGNNDCGCEKYQGCYSSPPIIVKAPLVARMTYQKACTPGSVAQTVTFTDNSTGGNYYNVGEPYSYLWNFGSTADYTLVSGTLTSPQVQVKYLSSGAKIAALTVTDSTLVSKTKTETISVDPCMHISTQASPGTFECDNQSGITNWLNTHGGAAVTGATGAVIWTWSPDPYTLAGGCAPYTGSAQITFTATDAAMNSATTSATLTVRDTKAPVLKSPAADLTVDCDGAGNTVAYNAWITSNAGATASDVCDTTPAWSFTEGSWVTDCGNTKHRLVTFWATDDCGNKSSETSATFKIRDTSAPQITTQASGLTVECDGAGNTTQLNNWLNAHGNAFATDICGSAMTWTHNFTSLSDLCGSTGSAMVTFWATDACGNKSAGTTAAFTIQDTSDPFFTCPQNITQPADPGKNYASLTIAIPTVSEACGSVTLVNSKTGTSNASGDYPVGKTTVTYTATDACNHVTTCTFTVTILDEEAPGLTCPENIGNISCRNQVPAPYADYDAFVLAGGKAVDNQGIDVNSFRFVNEVSSQTSCPEIITRVYEIKDLTGSTASCSQTITVKDLTLPVLTLPANTTVECGSNPNALSNWLASAVATDNCGTVTLTNNYGQVNLSDGCGNTGSVTVTWTAVDACGNKAAGNSSFTILDTTPPDFDVPAKDTIFANKKCEYDADPEFAGYPSNISDNCALTSELKSKYSDVIVEGSKPGQYIITRTWTFTDPCGNPRSKDQIIVISGAKAPPTLVLNETCVYLTKYGKWTLNEAEIQKIVAGSQANCGTEKDLTFTFSDKNFDCVDAEQNGANIVVTASDANGNTISGTVWITVADTLSPVAVCKDATVYLNRFGQAFLSKELVNKGFNPPTPEWAVFLNKDNEGSYDNCGIQDIFLSRQLFTCADLPSPQQITMVAVDPSGNTATCKAMITVLDTIKPVIMPVANVTKTVAPGVCSTKVDYPVPDVRDNCGVLLEKLAGLGPEGMFAVGTTTVETWKASNIGGASAQVSFTVTINTYNGAPVMETVADVTIPEDAATKEVLLSGISYGVDCAPQQILSLDVANSNTALIKVEKVYTNGDATGKLKITPLKDMYGEATITLTLKDNGGTANSGTDTTVMSFKVTVTPVNDPPTVTPIADQTVTIPNSLSVNVKGAFTDVDAGDVLTLAITQANGSALPSWMTFDASTGLLTGTPAQANTGWVMLKATATDKAGASVSDEFKVTVLEANAAILVVNVVKGTAPVTSGITVQLSGKNGTMYDPVVITPYVEGGTFTFYNVPKNTLLAKAVVTDPVANAGLLNTWHESSASLTGATQIAISAAGSKTVQISMLSSSLIAGEYKIMGKVVKRTGPPNWSVPLTVPGTPAPGIDLVLKQNGTVVANTITGNDGTYAFSKLPAGEYEVVVELAGYTQDVVRKVTVSSAEPLKDKIDFTIWTSDDTHVITRIDDLAGGFAMKLYPNPTTGKVNIDITWNDIRQADVTVFTLQGAQVFQKKYFNGEKIEFNLSDHATGVYMVKVIADDYVNLEKLIIDKR